MRENGRMEKKMGLATTIILMEIFIKDSGRRIREMG
jgi:hypothetical protein